MRKKQSILTGVNINNKASWNNAKSDGSDIAETLALDGHLTITILGNPWDYFYIDVPSGTGVIEYTINAN